MSGWVKHENTTEDDWPGVLRAPWEVGRQCMPLMAFSPAAQARINAEADAPDPPARWLVGELTMIPSRAWWEWHARRGVDPDKRRESVARILRELVVERDRGICQICLVQLRAEDAVHIDHVFPVSRGGKTLLSNLQLAHAACNLRKGARV